MEYRTIQITTNELNAYFDYITTSYKNMYNVANFYIRNCMTGIKKEPHKRTNNETEVLADIFNNIRSLNEIKINNWTNKNKGTREDAILALNKKFFKYPTADKWFLNKYLIDGVMKVTKNIDYYNLPSQVNQNAIYDCVEAWNGYFEALKDYKNNPSKYTGKPKIPKYKKSNKTTASFTNTNCKIIKSGKNRYYLEFPKIKLVGYNKKKSRLYIGKLGHNLKLKEVKVKPEYGTYTIQICYEIQESTMSGSILCGADLGVDNLITLLDNNGDRPLIVDGNRIKSINHYFNSRIAYLTSRLNKEQPDQVTSKRIQKLYLKRHNIMRDYMSKAAVEVINYCLKHNISTLVIGENKRWKDEIDTGSTNNQNICYIPHDLLKKQIKYRCESLGIKVVFSEESYTSKASLLDFDDVPTYKKGNSEVYKFSGKRIKRGLYKTKNGLLINADINGAGNILRKEMPNAFNEIINYQNPIKIYINANVKPKKRRRFGTRINGVVNTPALNQ